MNVFVNTHFAARLPEGTQLLLQCAFRLFYLPVGVFGVALAVVTTTQVADEAAAGRPRRRCARGPPRAAGRSGCWPWAARSV